MKEAVFSAIEFVHHGEPVPAARARSGQGRTYTPEKYRAYKEGLATALMARFREILPEIPGTRIPKERKKYLDQNRYRVEITVYRSKRTGDWDNFAKSVCDALQDAGLIADDSQIDEGHCWKRIDKTNPRIEFELERIAG
jgi:Holliday junction resolvase RusA-like endonuclease